MSPNRDISSVNVKQCLAELPLFTAMSPDELSRLAQGSKLRRLVRGEAVFHAGEMCEEFHVVIAGQVKLFAVSPAGMEKVIEIVSPGHSFAEAMMFTDSPYIISAQALTDALVLTIFKRAVYAEIDRDSKFALRMLAGISRRLHGLVRDVEAYALHSGVQRVIGYLLREHGGESNAKALTVSLPVSKAIVASRLSLTPEYFSRVLHDLEVAGLIEVDKRDIHIRDPQRLAKYQLD